MQECSWQMFNVMVGLHGIDAVPTPRSYTGLEGLWNVGVTRLGNCLQAHMCVCALCEHTHTQPSEPCTRARFLCM